jgi:macrodomain Ter protein organizer (MatP/YcbG family)
MAVVMSSMKVEQSVRERVSSLAQVQGLTVSQTIASLLDEHERHRRFAAVAAAYADVDAEYLAETGAWDEVGADGLGDR